MLVAWDSFTGNVERFVYKLNLRNIRIEENLKVDEPFILITYTTGFGKVPEKTKLFLKDNNQHLKGVSSSGNKNWGDNFAIAADIISMRYNVPIILKFELSGTKNDVHLFCEEIDKID